MRGRAGLNPGPRLRYHVEKYKPPELDDCIALREVQIYKGSPLKTLGQGGCTEMGGLTTSGGMRGKP
jgi:hypothetical protein